MNRLQDMKLFVLCPTCSAPTAFPKEIEKKIELIRNYECWECKNIVRITQDLKNYVYATRGDD